MDNNEQAQAMRVTMRLLLSIDYTAEGAANRDAYMRECLRRHHLPPRADVAQPVQPMQ